MEGARKTLLENLACLRSAEGCFPKWLDALDSVNHVCHKWWPPGHFPGGIDGIPAQTDVDKLRAELVQLVEDLQLRSPTLRVVAVRKALEAMEADADGGEYRWRRSPATKEADADGGDGGWQWNIGGWLRNGGGCRWNGGGGVEADADGKEAMALRKGFSPFGTIECRELGASAFVDSPSCSRMKRSKRKAVEDHSDAPCANKKASSPFRLVDLDGHICLQDRLFTDDLLKKHIVFFMEILLRFLPLGRIKHVQIMEFHRLYATEIYALLGGRYELWRWRKVFIK